MFLERLLNDAWQITWIAGIFAVAIPLELWLGSGPRVTWSERLANIGAMLVFILGGGVATLLLLATPVGPWLTAFPRQPRLELLRNPVLWAVAVTFVSDGLYYIYHRLQHAVPLLWHVHKLHHTDPAVNVTTSERTHFLERPLQFTFTGVPALWLLGLNVEGIALSGLVARFFLHFSHLDIHLPLGALTSVIVGPHYHRLHHGRAATLQNVNFAQAFPLFDVLGGTYRRPGRRERPETGIQGCETTAARWRPILW